MSAINEKQRAFVENFFLVRPGKGAAVRAAKLSGYGNPGRTTNARTWSAIASRLAHDDKVQLAILEYGRQFTTALAPVALRALTHLLETPSHRDHCRAIGMALDKILPTTVNHSVSVEHHNSPASVEATAEVMSRIAELALRAGIQIGRLPPVIDAKPVESEVAT